MKITVQLLTVVACVAGNAPAAEPNPAIEANSNFACDLYHQLADEKGGENFFFSPYSVSSALAMTAEGARGETALQMGKVLRYPQSSATNDATVPWDMTRIHSGMAALNHRFNTEKDPAVVAEINTRVAKLEKELNDLKEQGGGERSIRFQEDPKEAKLAGDINAAMAQLGHYELNTANALWFENSYRFKEDYLRKIAKYYKGGGAFPVHFKGAPEKTRLEINSWVEGQTKKRIKDLIPEDGIGALTRLILVNAIYFKGDWAKPFKVEDTKDRNFNRADGSVIVKPTMYAHSLEEASYAAFNRDGSFFKTPFKVSSFGPAPEVYPGKNGFSMLELPYMGDELSMLIIAPNSPGELNAIEDKLTPENLAVWIPKLKKRKVHVLLPKFKVETSFILADTEEPGPLQKMGMIRAFVDPRLPRGAVFDGMSHVTNPNDKLYISKVIHKAFVEVNEEGTEAAAATAAMMFVPTSRSITRPFTPVFSADRPFLYLIRDRVTGSILFMGRIMEPTS